MLQQIHLIRHGETEWTLSGQHTGVTDIPLTECGRAEARELARGLQGISFAHVLTSPLQRARRTGELAALIPALEIEPNLVEWNYGDYEGERSADILQTQPGWNLFRDGGPNGESPAQVSDRADRLIARLRTLKGNVALFTHGHFGRVLAVRWIGLPVTAGQHFQLGTASISILGKDPHHQAVPVIARWNTTSENVTAPDTGARARSPMATKQPDIEQWENEGGEIPNQPPQPAVGNPS